MPSSLLWDVSAADIDAREHRAFLVGRVLSHGSLDDIRALRRELGDSALRAHLGATRGRHLDKVRLRYFEAILDLDSNEVSAWLTDPSRRYWDAR